MVVMLVMLVMLVIVSVWGGIMGYIRNGISQLKLLFYHQHQHQLLHQQHLPQLFFYSSDLRLIRSHLILIHPLFPAVDL